MLRVRNMLLIPRLFELHSLCLHSGYTVHDHPCTDSDLLMVRLLMVTVTHQLVMVDMVFEVLNQW